MLRRDLKVVGNHLSRCNNSGPRNMRENHYAILARLKISYVLKSQDKHNASYFSKMSWSGKTFPSAKLTKIFENERIGEKKIQFTKLPTQRGRMYRGTGIFRSLCIGYRKRRCRRCGVRAGLLRSRRVFRRIYPCGSRCARWRHRLTEWQG